MKLAGHTMGTPEYTLPEAINLFKEIGLEGIEIVVQDGYQCGFSNNAEFEYVKSIGSLVKKAGLEVSCLTPYFFEYNNPDAEIREKENRGLERVIEMADWLDAGYIRIYGGRFGDDEVDINNLKKDCLIESMRRLGDKAKSRNVTLVLENHFHTMTTTAVKTAAILEEINHPNVGILYDQANLAFLHAEEYEEAIALQKKYIKYIHTKDLVYRPGKQHFKSSEVSHINEEDRIVNSRIIGQGIIPWEKIIAKLKSVGYDGWLSLEYERRWSPLDLPDARIGMAEGAKVLREFLG
jgi:L-ribulose-5-phosphate 3-epimerase